ncbi:hypothetical protein SISNIDRAFT_457100 [Sistotremastrum niveocremeum HHB9708]|uniref:DUF7330 domain-containing protein n=1 Tax=Sistotremastrum niveocremeum HHB9708 TaxID=1314777 RepID=A0A164S314_9AGAM|nr:hypothetical protein SISNIDRAFT_457100 [Sistotremastrum niveocremeum HHB9708]
MSNTVAGENNYSTFYDSPPAYPPANAEAAASSRDETTATGSTTPNTSSSPPANKNSPGHATNFLDLENQGNIKGYWKIDSSMKIPSSLLGENKLGDNRPRPNLYLQTTAHIWNPNKKAEISGTVEIVGESTAPRAYLFAESSSDVSLKVISPLGQKSKIHCESFSGGIKLSIPRTFRGPIYITTRKGPVILSAAVRAQWIVFSEHEKGGIYFHGQYSGSGYDKGDEESVWLGDEINATAFKGEIRIEYADEQKVKKGLFAKFLS